jgi:hypothetical protein
MWIVRSIAAIVIGLIVQSGATFFIQSISTMMYPLPEGVDPNDFEALRRIVPTLPAGALAMVLLSWESGALLGGATAALIASRGRVVHAGIIGGFVLLASAIMIVLLPHPTWMVVAGLLLPVPIALLAGKLVAAIFRPPARPPVESKGVTP